VQNPALSFRPDPGTIPDEPGCYQFKDHHGRVVYVGKAKSLRSRLASYFQAWHNIAPRTRAMLEAARSLEWIVVDNEVEALHLEYTLIQKHIPRYNVRYRDDKSYPYLVLTTSEDVPRARVQRGGVGKGDRRFGPYAHAYAIRETLDLLLRIFPVRTCSQGVYDRAARMDRPCLYYHIGKCAAPCVGHIGQAEHRALVESLGSFLDGDTEPVLRRLEADMDAAATELNFEAAARLRDQLFDARKALSRQQMASSKPEDFDVVAFWEDDLEAAVQAFFVRRGRVVGRKGWTVDKVEPLTTAELYTSFLLQLYEQREDEVPPLVLVEEMPDDADALSTLLADLRRDHHVGAGRPIQRVELRVPSRGEKVQILQTVKENARQAFERHRLRRASDFNARSQAMRELQEALDLDTAPLRIECYDISHLGGTEVVASMVVFEDGLPRKNQYRRFKLSQDRNDDFAAMREVIERRFRRFVEERARGVDPEQAKFAYPPGLVIVDGGPGQLTAALEGFGHATAEVTDPGTTADVEGVAFVSLAKRFEELYLPGRPEPVVLSRGSEALYLVQRLRDEAHRFAVSYQRGRRTRTVASGLEEIDGIGPARRRALLRRFGSLDAIRSASVEELAAVPGLSQVLAERLRTELGR
jgi:excinuclease ABC subunit C